MTYTIDRAGKDIVGSITTDEGLVSIFDGPGVVYLQTRNFQSFAETLNPFLPSRERGQAGQIPR